MTTTEIITDTAAFRDIGSEWSELLQASSCNNLFLTWEWMYTWWLHLSGNRELHIIVVRLDSRLIAIAPLALCPPQIKRLMPFRVLEFLASDSVGSDYLNFVIRSGHEASALHEISESLTRSNYMLELVRVEKAGLPMNSMARQLHESGFESVRLTTNYCPYVKLSGHSWQSYLDSLDKSHQRYFLKKLKRLNADFTVELKRLESESERQDGIALFIRLHLTRWSGQGGSNAFDTNELIRFHQAVSKITLELGWLRLYTLMLDGVPVASVYIFKYNNIFYFYQTAFDIDYRKYSVGMITLALTIKDAIAEGAIEFDFLHDDEAYKYLWARQSRELIRLEFYPPHVLGRVSRQIMLLKAGIKSLVRYLYSYQQNG